MEIVSISNEPTDDEPRNHIDDTEMEFVETENNHEWKITKAIWYGSSSAEVEYGRFMKNTNPKHPQFDDQYESPHNITIKFKISEGEEQEITEEITVKLTDGSPSVSSSIRWNTDIEGGFTSGYSIYLDDISFFKDHEINNLDTAVSQYKDLIELEEKAHVNQWYGKDKFDIGWDPEQWRNHKDVLEKPEWEDFFIDKLVNNGMVNGEYDEANRKVNYPKFTFHNTINQIHNNAKSNLQHEWGVLSLNH